MHRIELTDEVINKVKEELKAYKMKQTDHLYEYLNVSIPEQAINTFGDNDSAQLLYILSKLLGFQIHGIVCRSIQQFTGMLAAVDVNDPHANHLYRILLDWQLEKIRSSELHKELQFHMEVVCRTYVHKKSQYGQLQHLKKREKRLERDLETTRKLLIDLENIFSEEK